jgi:hypothetical protein
MNNTFLKPIEIDIEFDRILQTYRVNDMTIPDLSAQVVALAVAERKDWKFT